MHRCTQKAIDAFIRLQRAQATYEKASGELAQCLAKMPSKDIHLYIQETIEIRKLLGEEPA